jgi:hypothetical protein
MNVTKLFLSALISKGNIVNFLLAVLLAMAACFGLWLLATGQYQAYLNNIMLFSAGVLGLFVLTILFVLKMSFEPFKQLKN